MSSRSRFQNCGRSEPCRTSSRKTTSNRPYVKLKSAYDDNLTNYKADIPQLFLGNALCVFSNAIETRAGSLTAEWEHFFHWLRPDDEKEKIRREQIASEGTSAERFLAGLCPKDQLLD